MVSLNSFLYINELFKTYFVMERWCNKVAVVSGASAGIGAACCKALASAGMVVVGLARRQERIARLRDELPPEVGKNLHAIHCDITQEENVTKVFEWTQKELGGCDVLINNAGIIATALLSNRNNTKAIRETIDTNLLGTVFCTREAFHSMATYKNGNGHIVIVNSVAGLQVPNLGPDLPSLNIYPATKFALRAMNEIYRQEFQRRKTQVRVTTISPGVVNTDILPNEIQTVVKQFMPMLKAGEVADAVLWALETPPNVQVHNITIKPMGEKF
ncbi:farnesol dehydrogenase [Stomoxys calcitrans]|uniref:Dehydrogenase n=1 Tax=Stomoxys calcitrans TaxID=35570 RepID=A0A1I8PWN0_STOCA|nr:farnesol dehydrogenase [Stomoxys calcitrans]